MTKGIHNNKAKNENRMQEKLLTDTKASNTDSDWISALAKQATLHSGGGDGNTNHNKKKTKSHIHKIGSQIQEKSNIHEIVLSKQQRIERRQAKKRRREERKGFEDSQKKHNTEKISFKGTKQENELTKQEQQEHTIHQLEQLKKEMNMILKKLDDGGSETQRQKQKLYCVLDIKGKATVGQHLTDENIQPRKKDYGGLGLARNSLLISLRDVSFIPKLEQEFQEHVHGFFGKQRTKAMKKQLDGNMLWRRLQKHKDTGVDCKGKKNKDNFANIKLGGKKLSDMTPDERVEAMIKLDMI
jgi:hypothetical protein